MTFAKGGDYSLWDGGADHDRPLTWSLHTWDFAFIKVSEGLVPDPLFRIQWAAACGHIHRGPYHFFRPGQDPKASALKTLEILDGDRGELPIALDLEVTDGLPAAEVAARAKTWLSWYEQESGIRPIVYSSLYFLRDIVKATLHPWLESYRLWLAQYPFDKMEPATARDQRIADVLDGSYVPTFPAAPAPFRRVSFWQWSALGKPEQVPGYYMGPGYKKEIDLNFYNGSRELMTAEFRLKQFPTPTPLPEGDIMQGQVLVTLNIRRTSDTTQTPIGQLQPGDIVEASSRTNGWWRLTKITRGVNVPLPAAECYAFEGATSGYIKLLSQPAADRPRKITVEMESGRIFVADQFTELT